jgi:hypothetical protein
MDRFDPNIPGLLEGELARVAITDPQPFVHGLGNKVVDRNRPFTLTIEWEVYGQVAPIWLRALAGNWNVSVYAESLGSGPERRLGSVAVDTTVFQPSTDPNRVNGRRYRADIAVPPNTLPEHDPGTDLSGIYRIVGSVFLDSRVAGEPGYDLIGFSDGPMIQVEDPH